MERSVTSREARSPWTTALGSAPFAALFVAAIGMAACTNTSNDPAPGDRRLKVIDAGIPEARTIGPGFLWFAGSDVNAFTKDQTRASNAAGPAITLQPATFTGTYHDLAFDPAGNLWTVPITGDQIMRVPRSGLTDLRPSPDMTITSTALKSPQTIAFDASGNLWVINFNGSGPAVASIVRFDGVRDMTVGTHMLNPSVTIGPGTDSKMIATFAEGLALAFDKAGSLWFGGVSSVMRLDSPGSLQGTVIAAPSATLTTGDSFGSIAFDGVGSLWVTAANVGYFAVRVNDPGMLHGTVTATPAARVTLNTEGANFAGGMAFDAEGSLWIAMSNRIIKLANPSSMVGNVAPGPEIVLGLPTTSFPDLASKLAFWPSPAGLPLF